MASPAAPSQLRGTTPIARRAAQESSIGELWIGTSGWTYDGWRGPFYPGELARKRWLQFYSTQFATTEINGSFYRTPSVEAVQAWHDQTPDEFRFAWKASKFITHWKRLSEASVNSLELLESRLRVLGKKLGPVLFQLPARFKADPDRLASFLKLLVKRRRYAFEFRDTSWYDERVFKLLRRRNIALCISDHHDAPTPWEVTADHAYIRGHGPTGRYHSRYGLKTMREWAANIANWRARGLDVHCYFDNDQKSAAPKDAKRLVQLTAPRYA
jgi:uncharacterized protein YecE (DUF72 family)